MLKVNLQEIESIAILEPNGELTQNDFFNASRIIDPYIKRNGILKGVIIYVKDFPGWESFNAFISHLNFIHNHHKLVSHVALVTDSIVGEVGENIANHFIKAKIKNFDYDKLENAKQWITNDNYFTHGLFFSSEMRTHEIFMKFRAIGVLTHEDYEKIMPILDATLENVQKAKINLLVDISSLESWELRAAWDDMKIGLKHGKEFDKIAIFGHKNWQKLAAKIGTWFISGEILSFESIEDAEKWLH